MLDNVLLVLLIVILGAKVMGAIFQKIGLDATLGELLTGILLGHSILNLVQPESIEAFAVIGSVLILFVAGMKQRDIDELYKDTKSLKIGITMLLIVGLVMTAFFYIVPALFGVKFSLFQALILALAFAIVDIGVPAKVLITKGLMNLPVGKITVRSSIVNIILGLLVFTLVTLFVDFTIKDFVIKFGGIIVFLLLILALVYVLAKLSKFVMKLHIEEAEFSLALLLVLAFAYITEVIGFSNVLGAFVAGVIVAKLPFAETRSFTDKIKSISFGLFIPLFFVWFGLEVNLHAIWENIILALLIFIIYAGLRFMFMYGYMRKYKFRAPALISSSMLSVDVESLVVLVVALKLGIFGSDVPLSLFAPSVFLSTLFIVILVAMFSKKELANVSS